MSTDTPRSERVTLSDEEREALAFTAYAEHEPAFAHQENHTRLWETLMQQFREVVEAQRPEFERILTAREQALREEIAEQIEDLIVTLHQSQDDFDRGWFGAVEHAARIARGGAR